MSKVKEAIEEVIEESYLLGLSQQEIRQDFKRFIDTCYSVIHENVKDRDVVSGLAESLAREQTCILIADRKSGSAQVEVGTEDDTVKEGESVDEFSERVARRKRQILRTIAKYDPQLVRMIDAQRFQGDGDEPVRVYRRTSWRPSWTPDWTRLRTQVLKLGYAATIGAIILLIWLGFIQKS